MDKKVIANRNPENLTELCDRFLPGSTSVEHSEAALAVSWKLRAQRLQKEAHVFYLVFKHPRTRWYARLVAAGAAGYVFSPIQLIPNFIPVIGCMDDVLVVFLGVKLIQRITPADVLLECRRFAEAAEISRKEEIRSVAVIVTSVVIATVWLLAGIAASAFLAKYIRR